MTKKPVLVTRERAAEMLGVKPADLTRRIHRGELRTANERVTGGKTLQKIYEEDILFVIQHAKKTAADAPSPSYAERYTPEDASKMFAALKRNKSVEDCVIELQIHPLAALAIKRAWDEVKSQVTLTREELDEVGKLGLEGTFPITSPEELMDVLRGAGDERTCTACKKRPATQCRACGTKTETPAAAQVSSENGSTVITNGVSVR